MTTHLNLPLKEMINSAKVSYSFGTIGSPLHSPSSDGLELFSKLIMGHARQHLDVDYQYQYNLFQMLQWTWGHACMSHHMDISKDQERLNSCCSRREESDGRSVLTDYIGR